MCALSPEEMYERLISCLVISREELDEICDKKGFTTETLTDVLLEHYGSDDFSLLQPSS